MLALYHYRSRLGPCKHYLPETTAAENEGVYVGVMRRCHACTAQEIVAAQYAQSPQPSAVLVGVERRARG